MGWVQVNEESFSYDISARNEVIKLSANWVSLVEGSSVGELAPDQILGRSIWDFISGRGTRHIFEILFEKVRRRGELARFNFRCDSPDCRRFMSLEVHPLDAGSLRLVGRTLDSEYRPTVRLLDEGTARTKDFLTVCSWCKCVRLPRGDWVEVEVAVQELGLFQEAPLPTLTHGICSDCEKQIETF